VLLGQSHVGFAEIQTGLHVVVGSAAKLEAINRRITALGERLAVMKL
jgi:hypothetical protein